MYHVWKHIETIKGTVQILAIIITFIYLIYINTLLLKTEGGHLEQEKIRVE